MQKKILIFLLLISILVIASFLRLWRLNSAPPGLYPDEAINANDAINSLNSKSYKIFYPDNHGREGLFIWLTTLSFAVFGISIWSFRIVPALAGILTVLGLYLFTKEILQILKIKNPKKEIISLLSSFFLAISFWHINFSRIGFRAILIPFLMVFGFYFLFRGFRTKKILNFIVSGIFLGLGFYTYISYRFIVLLLAIVLFCWYLLNKNKKVKSRKQFLKFSAVLLIVIFIIALPIGIYFLKNPADFLGRAKGVSILSQKNPIYETGKSLILHLAMFNLYGDVNWRHNFAGSPVLLWPVGIFFLIGLVLLIKNLLVSKKKKNYTSFAVYCPLISWFFIMLLPGVLSYESIPHSLRIIGVMPMVYIFSAFGAFWIFEKIKSFFNTRKKNTAFLLCVFIFFITLTYTQFSKYFFQWVKNPEAESAFSKNYVEIGNYLNSLPEEIQKYVIVNELGNPLYGISIPAQTPMFIESTKFKKPRANYIKAENLDQIKTGKQKTLIIPLYYSEEMLEELQKKFPSGLIKKTQGIEIYEIN